MKIDAYLVNSFTKNGTGGNPAGVVLDAEKLSNQEKLAIAKAVGYSETAFVCCDDEVDFNVSFFTVTEEVDFCGHATLAVFSTLFQQGIIAQGEYVQRTKAGLLTVAIEPNGHIVMEQKLPEYLGSYEYEKIAELIGINAATLESTQLPIEVVSTGLHDMIVPVPRGYLDQLQVNEPLLTEFCKRHGIIGIHAFELCEKDSELTASCRNFAPLVGIPEESATGSASGALACYLTKHLGDKRPKSFVFEQGRAMDCVSIITASVELNGKDICQVKVGGFAHEIGVQEVIL
ncbi:PhzF family phenazine biosynthesis protein [Psychrobacter sp. B38]|uniref:PhzF family phenazine biosynthesis protein n=1 Tax=Psychrobacter sp. B38 TaxID=3143538 RepID=UPI00320EA03D